MFSGGAAAPIAAPPAAPAASASGAWMTWNGIGAAASAVCQTVSAIYSYIHGKEILASQMAMAKNQIQHGENTAALDRDAQLEQVKKQEDNLKMTSEMHAESLKAKEELRSAEADSKIIDTEIKESKLTQKTGEINQKKLGELFDTRGRYKLGNPRVPSHLIERT